MRHLQTSWKHIRRNPYQALAAILIMMLTFLAISVFSFIVVGSSTVIKYFESSPQVTAFFKDEAKLEDIKQLEQQLRDSGKVASTHFVSKEQALKKYTSMMKSDPLLLELVTSDVLPSSLDVSANKIEDLGSIAQTLRSSPLVRDGQEGVAYDPDIVENLTLWTNAIRNIGIVLIVLLAAVSVFILITVIGFKVSQRKEEIEIMRLLSATGWYIRWPFILEGVIYGTLGTTLGWLLASGGLMYVTPYLDSFMGGIPLLPASPIFLFGLLFVELLIAVILGVLASSLAVFRYLK